MSYGKRRAGRREGAGAKAPECAIAAGRWVGRQTRCLVSLLTKRAINSIKTGQFILNQGYGLLTKLTNICTTSSHADPQMLWNLNARVSRAQGALAVTAPSENIILIYQKWAILSSLHAILVPRVLSFFGSRAVRYNQSRL